MNQFHKKFEHPITPGQYWVNRMILIKEEDNGRKTWRHQDAGYATWDGKNWTPDDEGWDVWYGEKK